MEIPAINHSTPLVLGLDGGGSKTACILATPDGEIVGRGYAGASNHQSIGIEQAERELTLAVDRAFAEAGLVRGPVAKACFGLSGVDREEDLVLMRAWLAKTLPSLDIEANAMIANDARLVLAAGTPDGWGIALICGTGAICVGRDAAGMTARADGWGYLLGDDGSGYFIARAGLRAIMRALDGRGPQTVLTEAILTCWELSEPERLLYRVYHQGVSSTDVASLSKLVGDAAEAGDAVALNIIQRSGEELAITVRAVAHKLGFEDATPCALAGGAITKGRLIREGFLAAAADLGLNLDPVQCVDEPVTGALRLALRMYEDNKFIADLPDKAIPGK